MDLRTSPADEAFRAGLREFLAAQLPTIPAQPARDDWPARRTWDTDWQRRLFDAGYAGLNWPKEYGGQEASPNGLALGIGFGQSSF
jgi:alkylation response protein AidB-like acyl-CoA dehydrogenase